MKRFLSILLCGVMLASCMGGVSFAADETSSSGEFVIDSLEQYVVYESELADDGHIGIPVGIKTYASGNTTAESQIIYYVVNTSTERIGTESDEAILTDLISRNLVVIVLDYKNNEKAVSPDLDWSIQGIRGKSASYTGDALCDTAITYVVPAGYNITLNEYYWSIDKHGADGSLERIVEIWNNDFLGVRGSSTITLADGTATTVADYTASLEGGAATDITQLIKPDGTPIDMDLRMDIIYPTNPANEVPVMSVASSSETRVGTWTSAKRPHLTGFLFGGYAGVIFDYAYVPMARNDHFGYYDGSGSLPGSVTGDNYTYSMAVYSGIKSDTAAIRKIRYLADYESDTYKFDLDKIGVYGNSKGGLCTRLGAQNVTELPEERYFPAHHGETRYENGITEDIEFTIGDNTYTIDGGEEQPWLTYQSGDEIPSNVQFVYANCGGGAEYITEGHAPTYATGSMKDGSYFEFFPSVVNALRIYDIPSLVVHCPERGHEFAYGLDRDYGIDTYYTFHELANYYLKGDSAICKYIDPVNGSADIEATSTVTVKFTGVIPAEEIEKISITNTATGEKAVGVWSASYGNTQWEFTPENLKGGYTYSVYVPKTIMAEGGTYLAEAKTASFTVKPEKEADASLTGSNADMTLLKTADGADNGVYFMFDEGKSDFDSSTTTAIRFKVENDAANTVLVYAAQADEDNITNSALGELLGEVALTGAGEYDFDVTDYVNSLDEGEKAAFILKAKNNKETKSLSVIDFEESTSGVKFDSYAAYELSGEISSSGSQSAKIKHFTKRGSDVGADVNSWVKNLNDVATFPNIIKTSNLTEEDYGRKFNISVKVYDTTERQLRVGLLKTFGGSGMYDAFINGWHNLVDWNANTYTYLTEANTWSTYSFDYRIDNPNYYNSVAQKKTLMIAAETMGDQSVTGANEELPFYIDDVEVTEYITEVKIADVSLVLHPADKISSYPLNASYGESGANKESSFEDAQNLIVSGRSRSMSTGANKKVYAKVDLASYSDTSAAMVNISVTSDSCGEIAVYGIADKAESESWSYASVNYINAPVNDRYGAGVDLSKVFEGAPLDSAKISGAGYYSFDITDYASYMTEQGADEGSLIFVMESEPYSLFEDFNDESADFYINPEGGPEAYGITKEANYPDAGGGASYKLKGNQQYHRVKMDLIDAASLTEEDIGRQFTVTFKAQSDRTGKFYMYQESEAAGKWKDITEVNTWGEYSYDFTLTESMLSQNKTYLCFQLGYYSSTLTANGDSHSGTTATLYIDDIAVSESGAGNIEFEFISELNPPPVDEDFNAQSSELTVWVEDSPTASGYSTENYPVDEAGYSYMIKGTNQYTRVAINLNLVEKMGLTSDDVGREVIIKFNAKSDRTGSFYLWMQDKNTYRKIDTADTWGEYEWTVALTEAMITRATNIYFQLGLYASTNPLTTDGEATLYIDNLVVYEPEDETNTPYSYSTDMETYTLSTDSTNPYANGSVFGASASNAANDELVKEGVIAGFNGFTWFTNLPEDSDRTLCAITTDEKYSGEHSLYIQSTQSYNRVYFYNVVDELTEGDTYKISFWMKADTAGTFNLSMACLTTAALAKTKSYTISEEDVGVWKKYRYEFTVDATMVEGNMGLLRFCPSGFGQLSDDSKRVKFYIDDLASMEYIEGEGEVMEAIGAKTISNVKLDNENALVVNRISSANEEPDKIRKAYLHFEGGEYENTQKATLNIDVLSANGQTVEVYGIINSTYPAELSYESAPGSNADESMNTAYLYGGAPLAVLELDEAGIYSIDVTEFVKTTAPEDYIFAMVSEDIGGCEYLNLDFEAIPLTNGVDYVADSDITITDGAAKVAGSKIQMLNVFGSGNAAVKAGETYTITVDVTTDSDTTVTVGAAVADGTMVGDVANVNAAAGVAQTVEFDYIATAEDEANGVCTVVIEAGAAGFSVDNINVISENVVVISKDAELMLETAKLPEIDAPETVEITVSNNSGSVIIDEADEGYTVTKEVSPGTTLALSATGDGQFLYWVDANAGTILSYNVDYGFTVGSGRSIAAIYADNTDAFVTFTSMGNKLISAGLASVITVPEAPYVYGYKFDGWYAGGEKAELTAGGAVDVAANTEFKAGFAKNSVTYTVTINGVGETYTYNDKVTVTADAENFSYWKRDNEIVSYNAEYSFYVDGDTTVDAVYGESVSAAAVLVMAQPTLVEGTKIAFFAERDIPTGCTLIETGILIGTSADLDLDNAPLKATAKSTANKGQYTVRKANVEAGQTWYGVAYAIYRDTDGTIVTAYSNEVIYEVK